MLKEIVLASGNHNKLEEIRSVAKSFGIHILSPKDIEISLKLDPFPDPAETGSTYYENALIKAQACFNWCGLPSIGDDSGLEVNVLNNAPGIYSARYAGPNSSDEEKIKKLLVETEKALLEAKSSDRMARFRSVLVLLFKSKSSAKIEQLTSEGTLEGEVLESPRGDRGFGYDPIIKINTFNKTLAELDSKTVFEHGFRAQATKKLFENLKAAYL